MFEIDHLMIEVDDPLKVASHVSAKLGLSFAWPLTEKEAVTVIAKPATVTHRFKNN